MSTITTDGYTDIRDFPYQPALLSLKTEIDAPDNLTILDQGMEGTCTDFGLAAVINIQLSQRGDKGRVSPGCSMKWPKNLMNGAVKTTPVKVAAVRCAAGRKGPI